MVGKSSLGTGSDDLTQWKKAVNSTRKLRGKRWGRLITPRVINNPPLVEMGGGYGQQ